MNQLEKLYAEAVGAMNQGRWRPARELGEHLLRMSPDHSGAHFICGMAASRLRQNEAAIAHLKRAAALEPERPEHWVELARAYLDGWLMGEAVSAADRAFALESTDALVWVRLGVIYGRTHVQARSAEAFSRAVAITPDSAGYRFNLVVALMAMGDIARAERECLECLRLNPRFWKAWLMLAQLRKH